MLVKKTPEEIKKAKRLEANRLALFWSSFIFVLVSLMIKSGYRKWTASFDPIPWETFFHKLPIIIAFACGVFVFARCYYLWKKPASCSWCIQCGKIFQNIDVVLCACGGNVARMNEMKWVEISNTNFSDGDSI
jgi:hypothetical protein